MGLGMTPDKLRSFMGLKTLDVVLILLAVYLLFRLLSIRRPVPHFPLPPGPRPIPLLGNLLDLPKGPEGPHWSKHKALYGPVSSIRAFGTTIIIVNDRKIAFDLLERRFAIYSDRPWFPFGGQMVGFDRWLTTFKFYNDEFRLHRKLFHNFIGTRSAMTKFEKLEEIETRRFLLRVFNNADNFMDYIRALPGTLILKMSYGYTTDPEGSDPLVNLADEVMADIFSRSCVFGNWVVDILPFVRHLPEWLPGMDFKRNARVWSETVASFCNKPYAFVQRQMADGKAFKSFVSENIEKGISERPGEDVVKHVAASLYAGGADTTVSAIATFYLTMVLYAGVLKRAQEEIDRVIGQDRLPTFSDRGHLPYIEALVKETLRWENVVPLNMPHMVTEGDNYMGYSIPKGALILANIWQMTHDSEDYYDPLEFKPERFLGENGRPVAPDPRTLIFGFGRRICPGKELADNSLFIAIAMSAAVFDISKSKDKFGNGVEPRHEYVSGVISHPKPFQCSIKPRSQKAVTLIQSILDENPPERGDGDILKDL